MALKSREWSTFSFVFSGFLFYFTFTVISYISPITIFCFSAEMKLSDLTETLRTMREAFRAGRLFVREVRWVLELLPVLWGQPPVRNRRRRVAVNNGKRRDHGGRFFD